MNATAQQSHASNTVTFDVDPTLSGVSFTGGFRSEFGKLVALRTTWWLSAITLALSIFVAGAVALSLETFGTGPGAAEIDAAMMASQGIAGTNFAMITLGALGVIAITTEFSTGAIRSSLTAVPQRNLLMGAKAVALLAWVGLVSAVMVLASHVVVALIAQPLGLADIVTDPDVAITYLTGWAAVLITSLLGFGLGTLLRSSAGGIVTLAIIMFVVQIALTIMHAVSDGAAWVEALMQIEYMYLITQFTTPGGAPAMGGLEPLDTWQAGLGLLIWALIPAVLGWLSFTRRDS